MEKMPHPDYEHIFVWESYQKQLDVEYRQSLEEGKDVARYKDLFDAVIAMPENAAKEKMADALWELVFSLPTKKGWRYREPSGLAQIRKERRPFDAALIMPDRDVLRDKVKGAWFGRVCGCLLGKPVEGIMEEDLKKILVRTGNYPMTRYIDREEITEDVKDGVNWEIDKWAYPRDYGRMPPDDDTNYMLLDYLILSRCGRDFTPENVASYWLRTQVMHSYCTAERVAYRNFVAGYRPPDSAIYKNPYREWIGAQIRADLFGYVNPCDPEKAAEMAWRDACVSHVKNGIYGEMWVAAMIAAAFGTNDVEKVILRGLAEVPEKSRLHEAVTKTVEKFKAGVSEEDCFADIHARWDEKNGHDWTHTVSNAEIVAASLLYGKKDYARSVGRAVMTGLDTDCNGATVGSVLGVMLGYEALPHSFTDRICDTLESGVRGFTRVSVSEMSQKTYELIPEQDQ